MSEFLYYSLYLLYNVCDPIVIANYEASFEDDINHPRQFCDSVVYLNVLQPPL